MMLTADQHRRLAEVFEEVAANLSVPPDYRARFASERVESAFQILYDLRRNRRSGGDGNADYLDGRDRLCRGRSGQVSNFW
jgi:hypothetical protein